MGDFHPIAGGLRINRMGHGRQKSTCSVFRTPPATTRSFPPPAGLVSSRRGDGRDLFYMAPDKRLMAVTVVLPVDGAIVKRGLPVALFTLRGSDYAVTPDGQRFLVNLPTGEATVPPITVVLNWRAPR